MGEHFGLIPEELFSAPGASFLFPPDIMHLFDLNLVPLCVRLCIYRLLAGLIGAEGFESIGDKLNKALGSANSAKLTKQSIRELVDTVNQTLYAVSLRSVGDALPGAYIQGGGELVDRLQSQWAASFDEETGAVTWSSLPQVVSLQASQCRTLLISFGVALALLDGNCEFAKKCDIAEFNKAVEKSNKLFNCVFDLYRIAYSTASSGSLDLRVSKLRSSIISFLDALIDLDKNGAAFARFSSTSNFEVLLGLPKALSLWGNLLSISTVMEEYANGRVKKEARSSSHALAKNGIGIFLEMKKNFELEMNFGGVLRGLLVEASPHLLQVHVRHWVPQDLLPVNQPSLEANAAPSPIQSSSRSLADLGPLPQRGVIAPGFPINHTLKCFLKYLINKDRSDEVNGIHLITRFTFCGRRTFTRWDTSIYHLHDRSTLGQGVASFDFIEDDPASGNFRQRPFGFASRASARPAGDNASCVVELLGALRLPTLRDHLVYLWAVYSEIVEGNNEIPEPQWADSNGALVVEPSKSTACGALTSRSLAMTTNAPSNVLPSVQHQFEGLVPAVALPLPRKKNDPPRVLIKQLSYKLEPVEEIPLIDKDEEWRAIFGEVLQNDASASAFRDAGF